jgi:hypothetical protein
MTKSSHKPTNLKLISSLVTVSFALLLQIAANATSGADKTVTQPSIMQLSKVGVSQRPQQSQQLQLPQLQTPVQSEPPQSSTSLKGSVQGLHLLGQEMLGRMGSTAENIKKSCLVIMNELAMPKAVTGTPANVVGSTVLSPMPAPSGVAYIGHEDPNLKSASAAINLLIDNAKKLEDEISTTAVPAETGDYAKELWDKVREISEKMYADLNDLARLARSKGAEYEITKMEKIALQIYDKSEAINKLRRRIASELHKQK